MDFFGLPREEFFFDGDEICSGCSECDDSPTLVGEIFQTDQSIDGVDGFKTLRKVGIGGCEDSFSESEGANGKALSEEGFPSCLGSKSRCKFRGVSAGIDDRDDGL